MEQLKERDYSFDAIRGFCMLLIPLQHYMVAGGGFQFTGIEGYLFFVTDLFVMQGFFFLSGFFSKKPERSREVAGKALLWPLLMMDVLLAAARLVVTHEFRINILTPPFAMWFLLCLFYYRVFQKNYVKIPHFFGLIFLAGLLIGPVHYFNVKLSLARAVNWMPYFLLGYHCTFEQVDRIRKIKRPYIFALLAALLAGAWIVMNKVPFPYAAIEMYSNNAEMNITWGQNILMHLILLPVSLAFLVILFNLFPNKQGFWSYLGQNTMPIYMFHVLLCFVIMRTGLEFGLFAPLAVNSPLHLLWIVFLTLITTWVFVTKPGIWLYDVLFTKSYDAMWWCVRKFLSPIGGAVEKCLYTLWPFKVKE